jgi:hypothetical protein
MPSTRQHVKNVQQNTTAKMADETSRVARTMADFGERSARAGADMFRRNAEAIQDAWQSGTELSNRSTELFARGLGISGDEAQTARQQSLRNLDAAAQANTALAQAAQKIALECFEFARKRMTHNLDWFDALMGCRTLQQLMAVQSDFARDNLEELLQVVRRMAEISIRVVDQEVRNVTETLELAPGEMEAEQERARHAAAHQATARRTARPARMVRNPG